MKYASLTNLGCESEFSKLDHRIKITGGSISVQTLSRKNFLTSGCLLVSSEFELKTSNSKSKFKMKFNLYFHIYNKTYNNITPKYLGNKMWRKRQEGQ